MERDPDRNPAERLLDKLRDFVAHDLDDDERALFAALVAPGVARAYDRPEAGAEVEGFALDWSPQALPDTLAEAIRGRDVRIDGL